MKERSIVSIIVPIYNVEKYLNRCLKSIEMQIFLNFEALLIDDGSTDSSSKICQDFVKKDKRFKYYFKTNGGLSSARNFGLECAIGKYICFIDSDDYVDKNFLSSMFSLIKSGADVAQCKFYKFKEIKDIEKINNNKTHIETLSGDEIVSEYFNQKISINKITHNVCNKMFKKELFYDIKFKEGILYEDLSIMYLLLNKATTFISTNEILYFYNKDNRLSITHKGNYTIKNFNDNIAIMKEMNNFFINNKSLLNDFLVFYINQLINIYENSYQINNKEIKKARKEVIDLILSNINESEMGIFEKIKIHIRLLLPWLHKKYRIIKREING